MIRIGLTGNVASGKSTVARIWEESGVPVVSADHLAREAVVPGSDGLKAVTQAFGPGILDSSGRLDRDRMREIVFQDPEARSRLEAILHPRIAKLRRDWVEARRAEGETLVVSEVPLLFEAGLEGEFDQIVLVEASREERIRRMVEHRGIDPVEAERILSAQGDSESKRSRADHLLANDGTLEALQENASRLLERIRGPAASDRISGVEG